MDFVVISDTHFSNSSSVRTGSLIEDLTAKLAYVIDYCNEHNAYLLHTGDFFDRPSVPDLVKNAVILQLQRLNKACIAILGNHLI